MDSWLLSTSPIKTRAAGGSVASAARLALVLLVGGCGASIFSSGVAQIACAQDADCGAGAYCKIPLSYCAAGNGDVAGEGLCHRSCLGGACYCTSDDDCPGSTCSQGSCSEFGFKCPVQECSAACPSTRLAELSCPLCICLSCESADGGELDGGEPDGGAADAGGVPCGDAGTCAADELCFVVTGCGGAILLDAGAVGGCYPATYSCQSPGMCAQTPICGCLEMDDPCQGSTLCSVDGGVVSCQFDYP